METTELIKTINKELGIQIPEKNSLEQVRNLLEKKISHLLEHDFSGLINTLYIIDVNERKLKFFLQENVGEDAAFIIADLIIARESEKIKSRQQFSQPNNNISDEEKW